MTNVHPTRTPLWEMILLSGLLVGTLDILSAFVDFYLSTGKNPLVVFKYIASGLQGKQAFEGGLDIVLLGLVLHYLIAFSFTLFFWWIYPKWTFPSRNQLITGIVYGIFIWCVMNLLVVPLSNVTPRSSGLPMLTKIALKAKACLILICMIGLPLSFIVHRYYKRKNIG